MIDFFLRDSKFVAPIAFSKYVTGGIIVITNSYGESSSPWKIPRWIFSPAKFFLLRSNPFSNSS